MRRLLLRTLEKKSRLVGSKKLGLSVFVSSFLISFSCLSDANPVINKVSSGNVSISNAPNSEVIDQTSKKAILNWQSFNIGSQESTHFQQPVGGIALNKISASEGVSQIFGHLSATGQIILINPAGIYFGPSAYVNVGGLIASTANITDANFLAGHYQFNHSGPGIIDNEGLIEAQKNGLIALIGANISDNGVILANVGNVVLAAGRSFAFSMDGNNLIGFAVTSSTSKSDAGVTVGSKGKILANGGTVLISARTASEFLDNAINVKGLVQVNSIRTEKGEIVLDGGNGTVNVSGKLIASGKEAGETGGTVEVLGNQIALTGNAVIDASGQAGGGSVLIGGNARGAGPLPNATATVMMPGVFINASAINNGNGGTVVLWSNQYTLFNGTILAKGGALGGKGGYVETSSPQLLIADGIVDASAPNGVAGQWFMDPFNVTISTNTTTPGDFVGGIFTPVANNANINNGDIDSALNGGTNVTINTGASGGQAGTITLNASSPISTNYIGISIPTLELNASSTTTASAISLKSTIGFTGSGLDVTLISGNDSITESAGATITATALSTSSVKGQTLAQSNAVSSFSATNTSSGNISFTNTLPLTISSITQAGTGTITVTNTGSITTTGAISTTGAGTITLTTNGTNNGISLGANVSGAAISMTSTGALSQTAGAITATGASSFTAGANAISLTDSNALTGAVSLSNSGANDVNLVTSGALNVGTVGVGGTLELTAGGSITQTGVITATGGATTLAVTAGTSDILLNTQANNFGSTAPIFSGTLSNIRDIALRNTNASAATPSFLGITNLRNLTLVFNNAAVTLPAVTLTNSGVLTITAGGIISQTGAITVPGTSSFTAGANAITLNGLGNAFTGAVSLSNSGAHNVALTNTGELTLGTVAVGKGTLTIDSTNAGGTSGAITDTSNVITQAAGAGAASFTAGTAPITLTDASNSFTGAVSLSNNGANDVNLVTSGALKVGTVGVGSTLELTAGGNITQTGAITATGGATTLTVTAASSQILLNTQANDFGTNAPIFGGTLTNIVDLGLRNTNAGAAMPSLSGISNLVNLTLEFDNAPIALPALTLTGAGNLGVIAGGAITQTGDIVVPGTSSFTAGANPISLTTLGNQFTGAITLSNSGANAISVTNNIATSLAASTIGNNLTILSNGAITQTGALTIPGTASFAAGANAITLTTATNSITGAIALSNSGANNVSLINDRATVMAASTVGQNLSIKSVGALTQTGALTVPGTSSFTAGANVITLTNASNAFTGAITLSNSGAHAISVTNNLATVLAASTIGNNLTILSNGAITQTGALTIPGTASFTAGANSITLTTATNSIKGAITLSNSGPNDVSLTNNHATVMAASIIGQNLTINSTGAITQTGALTVPGEASFTSGANITLNNNGNKISSLGAITSGGVLTIDDSVGLVLNGVINAAGTGDTIVLAGTSFTNNVGANVLSPGIGNNFLIWSQNTPGSDVLNGLVYNFRQYNANHGVTTVLGTGNGFLYSIAPVMTANLTGIVSKVYDGTTVATLTPANYTTPSGAIDGDTVVLNTPSSGTYATQNVGTGITINSLLGLAILSATNGSVTVYGYQVSSTPGSANVGVIIPATFIPPVPPASTLNYGNIFPTTFSSAVALNTEAEQQYSNSMLLSNQSSSGLNLVGSCSRARENSEEHPARGSNAITICNVLP